MKQKRKSIFQETIDVMDDYLHNIYARRVSRPIEPKEEDLTFWRIVGIEAVLFGLSGIAAMIFSGIRTGFLFYVVEKLLLEEFEMISRVLSEGIGVGMAVTGLLAFEGYLGAMGFKKGKELDNPTSSKLATSMAFSVIVAGGVFSSMGLVGDMISDIKIWIYLIIALVMAIAGSIIVYYGGENIGYMFVKHEREKFKILDDYSSRYDSWVESGTSSFWSSAQGKSFKKYSKNIQNEQFSSENVQTEFNQTEKMPKNERAYNYVVDFVQENERIPTVNEAMNGKEFSRGYASYAINDFIVENGKSLIADGIIEEARYTKALVSQEKRGI